MNALTFTMKFEFATEFSIDTIKKLYIDRKNNIILLIQEPDCSPYIIYCNEKSEKEKDILPLGIDSIEDVCFVQSIGESSWLMLFNVDENNVLIFDNQGSVINKFHVGAGVQDCQVDDCDNIWISYSDEGIYGDLEIGGNGVIALDSEGNTSFDNYEQIVYNYDVPPIDDCYAMNVIDDEVWLYYYSEFPLIQLKNKQLHRWWSNIDLGKEKDINIKGFAVGKDVILFVTEKAKLILYSLSTKQHQNLIPYDEFDKKIEFTSSVCRGSYIYLYTTEGIYVTDLLKQFG